MSFASSPLFAAIGPAMDPAAFKVVIDAHFEVDNSVYFARVFCDDLDKRAGYEYEVLCAQPRPQSASVGCAYLVDTIDQRDGYVCSEDAHVAAMSSMRRHQRAFVGQCAVAL